jgi:hypothetical protein
VGLVFDVQQSTATYIAGPGSAPWGQPLSTVNTLRPCLPDNLYWCIFAARPCCINAGADVPWGRDDH